MSAPVLCFCLVVHVIAYVWSIAQGLGWWYQDLRGFAVFAFLVAGINLAGLYHDVTVAYDKLDEVARTIGDDDAPPGPPRGQE